MTRRRRRLGRGAYALAALLVTAVGCGSGRAAVVDTSSGASVLAQPDTYVDRVDGERVRRKTKNEPLPLAPGTHTVALRRRAVVAATPNERPPDYPLLIGQDEHDQSVYLSDTLCTVTLTVESGVHYTASAAAAQEPGTWSGQIAGGGTTASCSADTRVPRGLVGQSRFLCCTMAFQAGKATDANYRYSGAHVHLLAAGTPVRITDVGRDRVTFLVPGALTSYALYLEYGNTRLATDDYFNSIFVAADPTAQLVKGAPDIVTAVPKGMLLPGMTRAQAILARGYPPRHKTADLAQEEWYYYDSPSAGVTVRFDGDTIHTIIASPPPLE